jgi:hypothetical protein
MDDVISFYLGRMQVLATNIAVPRQQTHGKDHTQYVKPRILLDYQVMYHKGLFPQCSFHLAIYGRRQYKQSL